MSPLSQPSWQSRYPIHFQLIEVVVSTFSPIIIPVGNDGTLILFPQPQHLFLSPTYCSHQYIQITHFATL